jgi:hypothetical protein
MGLKKLSKKQILFTDCLAHAKYALDSIQVPFHISDGTCLGFYREEAFIEHDPDIDIGVFREDYKDDIIPAMAKNGFKFIKTFGSIDNGQEFTFEFNHDYLNKDSHILTSTPIIQQPPVVETPEIWGEDDNSISLDTSIDTEVNMEIVEDYQPPKGSVRIDIFFIYRDTEEITKSPYYWYAAYTYPARNQIIYKNSPYEIHEQDFMGLTVRVPEIKYIDECYGNWRKVIKHKDFNYMKGRNVCKPKFKDLFSGHLYDQSWQTHVTIGIKTFMRPHKLEKCLASVRRFYKHINIIVADDSKDDFKLKNKEICQKWGHNNISYIDLEWDVGLSAGRNAMVKACQTKYYITMDDDSLVKADTHMKLFYNFLEKKDTFHLIGGKCRTRPSFVCTYSHYSSDKTRLYYFNTDRGSIGSCGGIKAIRTDRVMNFFMARTEYLLKNLWDEDLKLCEHNNFFIRAWKKKWKIAFTPLVVLFEDMSRGGVYLKYRNRYEKYRSITWKKTGRLVKLNGNPSSIRKRGTRKNINTNVVKNIDNKTKIKKKSKLSKGRITLKKK